MVIRDKTKLEIVSGGTKKRELIHYKMLKYPTWPKGRKKAGLGIIGIKSA